MRLLKDLSSFFKTFLLNVLEPQKAIRISHKRGKPLLKWQEIVLEEEF